MRYNNTVFEAQQRAIGRQGLWRRYVQTRTSDEVLLKSADCICVSEGYDYVIIVFANHNHSFKKATSNETLSYSSHPE